MNLPITLTIVRIVLVLATLPLAITSNIIRITSGGSTGLDRERAVVKC